MCIVSSGWGSIKTPLTHTDFLLASGEGLRNIPNTLSPPVVLQSGTEAVAGRGFHSSYCFAKLSIPA